MSKLPDDTLYRLNAEVGLDVTPLAYGLRELEAHIDRATAILNKFQADSSMSAEKAMAIAGAMAAQEARMAQLAIERATPGAPASRSLIPNDTDIVNKITAQAQINRALLVEKAEQAQVADAIRAKALEEERAFQAYMMHLEQRRAAHRAEIAMERESASVAFDSQRMAQQQATQARFGGTVSRGGYGAEIRSSFYLGGALNALGIQVPMGLTSVLGRLEQVQMAMAAAFNVLAIVAFVEILSQAKDKLDEIWDAHRGLSQEARNTWLQIASSVHETVMELVDVKNKINEVSEAGLKGTALHTQQGINAAAQLDQLHALIKSHTEARLAAQQTLDVLKVLTPSGLPGVQTLELRGQIGEEEFRRRLQFAFDAISTHGDLAKAIEAVNNQYKTEAEIVVDLHKKQGDAAREEEKRKRQLEHDLDRNNKRMGDRVHELPWRLPWFMGPQPSQLFLDSLSNAPARRANFIPPATKRASTSTVQMGAFAPVLHFEGMPADAQAFVRQKMIPELHEAYKNNSQEAMDSLLTRLKEAGVAVNG